MLRPTGLKTDRVEVSLFPTINLEEERRKELKPLALGALEFYPDRIDTILGIPSDAVAPMLQMLTADRLKFVVLRGTKFRYRSARLHSFRLSARSARTTCRRRTRADLISETARSVRRSTAASTLPRAAAPSRGAFGIVQIPEQEAADGVKGRDIQPGGERQDFVFEE
jgi:hypothetical protein